MSVGRASKPRTGAPAAMAPELTTTSDQPSSESSRACRARSAMKSRRSARSGPTSVEEPIFATRSLSEGMSGLTFLVEELIERKDLDERIAKAKKEGRDLILVTDMAKGERCVVTFRSHAPEEAVAGKELGISVLVNDSDGAKSPRRTLSLFGGIADGSGWRYYGVLNLR